MGLVETVRSWWRGSSAVPALDVAARGEELRALYLEHLSEEPLSLEQRVAHHLYRLMLYWSREIGFLDHCTDSAAPGGSTAGEGLLMVRVGSELADADVRAYAAETTSAELAAAWGAYQGVLTPIPRAGEVPVARVRAAGARFDRVDACRRALGLFHRDELERPRGAAGSG